MAGILESTSWSATLIRSPPEIISLIASFLDICDAASFCVTNQHFLRILQADYHLWIMLVSSMLQANFFEECSVDSFLILLCRKVCDMNVFVTFLKCICGRIPSWPRSVDFNLCEGPRGPADVVLFEPIRSRNSQRIAFVGLLGDSERSVVADGCFPFLRYDDLDESDSPVPFAKVLRIRDVEGRSKSMVSFSYVAYYECHIGVYQTPPTGYVSPDCLLSVGLACPPFSTKDQLPGYDNFSFGYCSEDGRFYHGGNAGVAFGAASFGVGDVVGCGVVYGAHSSDGQKPAGIFFTKNGVQQGGLLKIMTNYFSYISWFPAVGIDTHHPISLNFGEEEFVFDIQAFESSLNRNAGVEPRFLSTSLSPIDMEVWTMFETLLAGSSAIPSCASRARMARRKDQTRIQSQSMFRNLGLFHRSLRIIDREVYKFQDILLSESSSSDDDAEVL